MKDYLKCVVANRFTLLGYIFCAFAVADAVLTVIATNELVVVASTIAGFLLLYTAFICLISTGFGLDTLRTYHKTKRHIAQRGRLDGRFYAPYTMYCNRCGVRLAAREAACALPPEY